MLFNSLPFLIFFPAVVLLYWCLPKGWRNTMLLIASYYFYMNWEPVYAVLIFFSSITTWGCALAMERYENRRKLALSLCISINLLILCVFKYLNFINTSVADVLGAIGISMQVPTFTLLLPVGISFYTFQAIGYTIDVYRSTIKAERSLSTYMLFVSFFPQLVAGPIERAKNLLPQFHDTHHFDSDRLINGLYKMTWGYFMKLCIADNVSSYVDSVFNNLPLHNGNSVLLAAIFFTFQIFCDFGGYSLIAIGAAHCMGFKLMDNFRQPYLATSIKDFWRRWHVSLTTWFTDYVYIPLGGNRCSVAKHQRNILLTFLLSGLWHGANWTFVLWGLYHGVLQSCNVLKNKVKRNILPVGWLSKAINIVVTFVLVVIGCVFFRANNVSDAVLALSKIATERGMLYNGEGKPSILLPFVLIALLMIREVRHERRQGWEMASTPGHVTADNDAAMTLRQMALTSAKTIALVVIILLCASFNGGQFIYFQF